MTDEIYQSMIQPRGREYRSDQIKPWSHYREPIDTAPGRLAGNSRVWGDASPEVQSRVIDELIGASQRAGLSPRETAHVLAIARIESGFNPDAAAGTTSAAGLGQFIDRTGAGLRDHPLNNGNRFDARAGSDALVEHFIENRNLARSRGQGEEYIYKYHHDGPTRDYGGLGLANREVMPRLDEYERFVRQRLGQQQTDPAQITPGQTPPTPEGQIRQQTPGGPRSFEDVMRVMLPPQNGVTPHMTSDYGPRTLNGRQDHHGGADFNYRGGQAGLNLQHPTVRSPVSGEVVFSGGQYGTVKIRDGEGNLHEILHLDSRSVQVTNPATRVQAGDPIGTMGGRGPNGAGQYAQHVHYQIRDPSGRTVDPEGFWDGRTVEGPARPTTEARAPRSEAMADGVLRQGERGAEVVAAQQALNQLGYTGRNGQPLETRSGIYGAETRHAVEDFQRRHGLKPDGLIGDDTRAAMATAAQRPLLSEATHPNHRLYTEIARQLPPGTRPEVAANVTLQALENGITSPDRLARVDVRGNDVFVMGSTPGDRVKVDLNAPTPGMQQMSDHTRQQSQQAQPMPTRTQEPVQTGDTEVLRPRTMLA
jgi:putative chitinase